MLLYSPIITPRLRFIVDFFSKELFDKQIVVTDDLQRFKDEKYPKINYGRLPMAENEFRICPVPLLFENGVKEQELNMFEVFGHKGFFPTYGGDFPFDILSASFYLISRYEEYLPHEKDLYGRYSHLNSLAFREKFLDVPLVNVWLTHFRKALVTKFPSIVLKKKAFHFIPTYDLDIAYSYLGKDAVRNLGGALKSLITLRLQAFWNRIQVLKGKRQDPFDSYEWLDGLHTRYKLKPWYFFLLAAKNKNYDKNILPSSPVLQQLANSISSKWQVGIHPSWQSYGDAATLSDEMETFKQLTGTVATHSRQHYIRFNLPETYRDLIHAGIRNDYSMGYGSINGFRASCASSFWFYDLEKEEKTTLQVHPFCFMDANAYYEQKFSTEEALKELIKYYDILNKVSGTMITIWHNQFLGSDSAFKGWRDIYETFITERIAKAKHVMQPEVH